MEHHQDRSRVTPRPRSLPVGDSLPIGQGHEFGLVRDLKVIEIFVFGVSGVFHIINNIGKYNFINK